MTSLLVYDNYIFIAMLFQYLFLLIIASVCISSNIYPQNYNRCTLMSSVPQPDPHENLHIIQEHNFQQDRIKKYKKGIFLGKGGFARCYQCEDENQQIYAVKIIQKSNLVKQRSKQKLASQIKIHKSLHNVNVVKYIYDFEDNMNVYILLQLCKNKSLSDLIKRKKRLSESQTKYYMSQVLEGIEYLHKQSIIHRDLKLGNLFLSQDLTVKIGDFGLASKLTFQGQKRKTVCGTPNYIAPEILEGKGHSYAVDVWSFGVIVYTLVYGRPPFQSKDVKETYKKIKTCNFTFPDTVSVSGSFRELIIKTLDRDPSRRPTATQLKRYRFFNEQKITRQPSFNNQIFSVSINKQEKDLSDNAKLYTNNQLMISRDTARQKSQDKFLISDRNTHSLTKNGFNNINRIGSQKILNEKQSMRNLEKTTPKLTLGKEAVCVKKWIDYSSKYGIGYYLSNGAFGVYFNDSTKVLAFDNESFNYIEKVQRQEIQKIYSFKQYPQNLKKKVSLYHHFKGYLETEAENHQKPIKPYGQRSAPTYVKRWFRSKHAVIFRLNNKTVQVIFVDQSQLLINASKKQVLYTNKNKQQFEYFLTQIMNSDNKQVIKRFQYTKQVLNEMASAHDNKKK